MQHFNNLSWSTTRITVLEYCQKKYFFNYYTHTLRNLNEQLRLETLLLKHLKSLEMRVWEKTHRLLSDYIRKLKNNQTVSPEEIATLKENIVNEMKSEYETSKNRDYTSYDRNQNFWLSEHYYGENVDDQLEPVIQKVLNNLDVFIKSDRHEKIISYMKKAKTTFVETPREKNFESMKVQLQSIPELKNIVVMAAPDFGVVFEEKKFMIIDWKSGHEKMDGDGVSDQIKIYALKSLLKMKADIKDVEIEGYEIYLPSLKKIGWKIQQEDIDSIIKKLIEDVTYQKQFLVDEDEVKNQPIPHENFYRTKSPKKCESCTFRKVCEDLKKFEIA